MQSQIAGESDAKIVRPATFYGTATETAVSGHRGFPDAACSPAAPLSCDRRRDSKAARVAGAESERRAQPPRRVDERISGEAQDEAEAEIMARRAHGPAIAT